MKKVFLSTIVLIALHLGAQAQSKSAVPIDEELAKTSTAMPVKGAAAGLKIAFGSYKIYDFKLSDIPTTKSSETTFKTNPGLGSGRSGQKLESDKSKKAVDFKFASATDKATVSYMVKNRNIAYNNIPISGEYSLSGAMNIAEKDIWRFDIMGKQLSKQKDRVIGVLSGENSEIEILYIPRGKLAIYGFEFRENDKQIGVVSVINKQTVWINNTISPSQQFALAGIMTVILKEYGR